MKQITTLQMFLIMILSRLFVTLMYMTPNEAKLHSSDLMLQVVIGAVLVSLSAIPIFLLLRDGNKEGYFLRCKNVSKPFAKISAVIFMLAFLFLSLRTLVRFDIFVSTVVFPDSDVKAFVIIMVVCSLYCVLMGLDTLGRVSEIFITLVVISTLFVLISTSNRIEFTNFTPVMYEGFLSPFKAGLLTAASCMEVTYPLILKDKIKGNILRCLYPWIAVIGVFLLLITFWGAGVLGDYGSTQLFPVFSITTLASVGFIEKLDVFLTAAWVVCVFVKICICIIMLQTTLTTLFDKLTTRNASLISSGIITILALFIKESFSSRLFMSNISGMVVAYLLTVVVFPVILLSIEKGRKQASEGQVS